MARYFKFAAVLNEKCNTYSYFYNKFEPHLASIPETEHLGT